MAIPAGLGSLVSGGGGLSTKEDFGSDVLGATGGKQSGGFKFNNVSSGGGIPSWVVVVAAVLVVVLMRKGFR